MATEAASCAVSRGAGQMNGSFARGVQIPYTWCGHSLVYAYSFLSRRYDATR